MNKVCNKYLVIFLKRQSSFPLTETDVSQIIMYSSTKSCQFH